MELLINARIQLERKTKMNKQTMECANDLLEARKNLVNDPSMTGEKLEEIILLLHEAADLLLMSA